VEADWLSVDISDVVMSFNKGFLMV
jgi:hypothetical protein